MNRYRFTLRFFGVLLSLRYCTGFSQNAAPPANQEIAESFNNGHRKRDNQRVKPIPYVATSSTIEHGKALSDYIQKGDRVLELGTQLDASSDTILKAIGHEGHAVLVDVQRTDTNSGRSSQGTRNVEKFSSEASKGDQKNYDYVEIEQFQKWKTILDQYASSTDESFDIFVLDATAMLGNDLELTTLSVIMEFVTEMVTRRGTRPRAVLVKSKAMTSLSRRLVHAQRLFDGSTTVDLKSPSRDGRPYIVAGVGVEEYRRTIPHVMQNGDRALEVGCFSGTTTALVHEAAQPRGYCIGVDIGPKIIERAKREHADMHFAVGDGRKSLELLRIQQESNQSAEQSHFSPLDGYDVVYADIGGLSGPDGTLESLSLMENLGYALEPRCIVIKSLCLRRLASSLRTYSSSPKGNNEAISR